MAPFQHPCSRMVVCLPSVFHSILSQRANENQETKLSTECVGEFCVSDRERQREREREREREGGGEKNRVWLGYPLNGGINLCFNDF